MIRIMMVAAALMALSSAAIAEERLECGLHGDDYPPEKYPDGSSYTWYIDGDKLMQGAKGSRKRAVPGLAWMKIMKRDEDKLIAEWPTMVEGASHKFIVDLKTGETEDTTYFEYKWTENKGICRLEEEAGA